MFSSKLDDLNTFKNHRNEISESLKTKFIGRDKEINEICDLLSNKNFIVITGSAGIGKSRLAIAAIERYISVNNDINVFCVKSFQDYINVLDESINESMKYLFFIDDANNYKKLDELIDCLNYHNHGNIKVIFTVRDYLKKCFDNKDVELYKINELTENEIKEAIKQNTIIKNNEWLNKIAKISKGNVRVAFVTANVALNDEKGFLSLFDVNEIMNSFYKEQITKVKDSNKLIITAGIISFFKSIYLEQLFYISPILNIVGMTKQEFLDNAYTLISKEIVDECFEVVRISDQCFSDFLLNYVFINKKYIKIKDLILYTYKYYKNKIVESINNILNVFQTEQLLIYINNETIDACNLIQDINTKHDVEATFASIILDYVVLEFKKGIDNYSDDKDISWLLKIFHNLAKSEYNAVAIEGIFHLLNKTNDKKEDVWINIIETYTFDYDSVKTSFLYLKNFVSYLITNNIKDSRLLKLVSTYLKYSFSNTKFDNDAQLIYSSFNINDEMSNVILFREKCWEYVFSFGLVDSLDSIIEFAKYHVAKGAIGIINSDLEIINKYIENFEDKGLIKTILYYEFYEDAKKYDFENTLSIDQKYNDVISIIIKRDHFNGEYDELENKQKELIENYYFMNKSSSLITIKDLDLVSKYYHNEIEHFLLIILEYLDEFSTQTFNLFVDYYISPYLVIEKAYKILGISDLYDEIMSITNESIRDEYLYNFYSFISKNDINKTFDFIKWVKSKMDKKTNTTHPRSLLDLKKLAKKSGMEYKKLIKIFFKKKEYNEFITREYLSYLFLYESYFKELIKFDKKLAINIYEFLTDGGQYDYCHNALKDILIADKNYIKKFARTFIKNGCYGDFLISETILNEKYCKDFLNEIIKICKTDSPYLIPFKVQDFVASNITNANMRKWIFSYIEGNYNNDDEIETLFSILAGINPSYKNEFILKYYEKGKNINILKCSLQNGVDSYSTNDFNTYFNNKINNLEALKTSFIKWSSLELVSYINDLIEIYKENINDMKVKQLVEYIDPYLLNELNKLEEKTEISLKSAFELYTKDEKFRELLSSGYVKYKNGSFVTQTNNPLKFSDVLKDKKISV